MSDWLKTSEAADYAGVAPTTIKRWSDEGRLECVRTPGGHRRYRPADLDSIVAAEPGAAEAQWIELACGAGAAEFESELLLAYKRHGAWYRVVEELGRAIIEIGARWSRGELGIIAEHRATERIHRALANLSERMVVRGRRIAILVNAPGDPHTLGLSLTEVVLREAGFETVWLGANVPAEDLKTLFEDVEIDLIAASASAASESKAVLRKFAQRLVDVATPHGTTVVLGGCAAWPEMDGAYRFCGWQEFAEFAEQLK